MKELLQNAYKFQAWKQSIENSGLKINQIDEVYSRHRHNGEVLFSLLMLDADTPEGVKIPPICFLKGQVVSIMVVLIDKETREKYVLLVKQRRICNGGFIYEHVAGMVDKDDDPLEVAIRETEEEAGLKLHPNQFHLLNEEPLYVSSGTSDENMFFYCCEIEMDYADIMALEGKEQGIISEHERITTHISTIPESLRLIRNTNGLLHTYMYLEHMKERA